MLFIWRGKGSLVILSLFLGVLLSAIIATMLLKLPTGSKTMNVVLCLLIAIFSSAFNYLFEKRFVSKKVKYFIDEETGERIKVSENPTLFFISNKYWTWIFLVGFLVTALISLIS
ncbi:hypothetical protein [Lactococcus protaetiae]|uniref:Uncharacterized protein n=1 Tax=Lactococcus protaetiae TaxID=2592653 RepID=A0A514Z808_9LACT|nr:hypothetical protein [Lactococcus protaetiae]MCL2114519.1 hypothetical protein [Streptococcaceae bacterium]QDK70726.1 hypothetical protein FLP15_05620 [Lactococcus protaetiae]